MRRLASVGILLAIPLLPGAWLAPRVAAAADDERRRAPVRTFDLRIERRQVAREQRVLRVTEGERVELRWTTDEPLVLHVHGYDIETRIAPSTPAVTAFTARLTGRFPVAIHGEPAQGRGSSSHHHGTLLHVEVHPR